MCSANHSFQTHRRGIKSLLNHPSDSEVQYSESINTNHTNSSQLATEWLFANNTNRTPLIRAIRYFKLALSFVLFVLIQTGASIIASDSTVL